MISLRDALKKFTALARPKHKLDVEPAPPLDLTRRHFVFGAAATVILPQPKSFFIMPPTSLILEPPRLILPNRKLFDLPTLQEMAMATKLLDGTYKLSDVPRWIVVDKDWYDMVVRQQGKA